MGLTLSSARFMPLRSHGGITREQRYEESAENMWTQSPEFRIDGPEFRMLRDRWPIRQLRKQDCRASSEFRHCRLNGRLRCLRVWDYRLCMPLTDRDGRTARQSVSRLLSRGVRDSEMAASLGLSLSTYSRRKDKSDFPTYAELRRLADRLGVDETILLVDFGHVDVASLNDELRERDLTYRNAIDVITSMRKSPNPRGS